MAWGLFITNADQTHVHKCSRRSTRHFHTISLALRPKSYWPPCIELPAGVSCI